MLVLLPPSEGKAVPTSGGAVDLATLSAPALTPLREKVLDALVEVSARPEAARVLGLGRTVADQAEWNVRARTAPADTAARVYSGVLHTAAGLAALTPAARARADRTVRIVSGLWGVVTPADRIPAYRLAMATDLPGIGPLAAAWRDELGAVLDAQAAGNLVVDCRSTDYLAAWHPPRSADWVRVRVVREAAGARTVVSHGAKHTRGLLVRHLLARRGAEPADAAALAAVARQLVGGDVLGVELEPPRAVGRGRVLTLVTR